MIGKGRKGRGKGWLSMEEKRKKVMKQSSEDACVRYDRR